MRQKRHILLRSFKCVHIFSSSYVHYFCLLHNYIIIRKHLHGKYRRLAVLTVSLLEKGPLFAGQMRLSSCLGHGRAGGASRPNARGKPDRHPNSEPGHTDLFCKRSERCVRSRSQGCVCFKSQALWHRLSPARATDNDNDGRVVVGGSERLSQRAHTLDLGLELARPLFVTLSGSGLKGGGVSKGRSLPRERALSEGFWQRQFAFDN